MKAYPSIPGSKDRKIPLGEPCIGFYKYDGSNLRWEWSRKKGWYKFGTRHRLFGADEAPYNQAIPIFLNDIGPSIEKTITTEYKGIQDFIVYTEFFGKSSFAGNHDAEEAKRLVLFDVHIPRKGLILPRLFLKMFGTESFAPEVMYDGNLNQQLIDEVRAGKYDVDEGMVCKGVDTRGMVWMVKIKTDAYLAKLKNNFGDDWDKYAE